MSGVSAVSKFLALKMHNWRGQYQRVFSFGENLFQTLDPATFAVTNAWKYEDIIALAADPEHDDQFTITLPSSGGMFSSKEMTISRPSFSKWGSLTAKNLVWTQILIQPVDARGQFLTGK